MEENQQVVSLNESLAIGDVFSQSGMFPDIKTKAQAAVKILAGRELGLSAFESMKNLYLVNGKLAMQANAMASLIKKSLKYDYKVDKIDETECAITFFQINGDKKESLGTSTFTFKEAAKAGLVNKDNWKNFPKNMLFARALSNGVRFYCPDAVCGWHTSEELQDSQEIYNMDNKQTITLTEDGEVLNGQETIQK